MKYNLTKELIYTTAIQESLVEHFGENELKSFSGLPSKLLGLVLNKLAEEYGDDVVLNAFNGALNLSEAATMPFNSEDKAELKKAIDQGGSPDAISALVKTKAMEKDPKKAVALAKLDEAVDSDEELLVCDWCGDEFEPSELYETDIGNLCATCISAIKSRGEDIWVKQ